ncbi:nitroreductase family deazaflavin-dependent oxidoreductase [Mycobacterium hubeiense]|uniref:nitroreductase family deazaflavin-dependent oxidoreductase n=1 Tax=Mycobacterium hubeiense TaxID=1867256 RepID=UPI000C7EDCD6|nr:nitroreductase family deazaflavin-dependent oxidoreductase [Mycobacterium sp. QGD 101]
MLFSREHARFNRRVTNRVVLPLSGWLPAWSVVEHVGRRSGRTYRTPVSAFRTVDDGIAILLPYQPDRDWLKNLQAAGGGRMKIAGRTFDVADPRIVPTRDALALLKSPWRQLLKRTGVEYTLLLRRA